MLPSNGLSTIQKHETCNIEVSNTEKNINQLLKLGRPIDNYCHVLYDIAMDITFMPD